MTQHTPGPWTFMNDEPMGFAILDSGYRSVAMTQDFCSPGEEAANAKLIAAAPELLALLVELIDIEGPRPGTGGWAEKVRAAIAKATL